MGRCQTIRFFCKHSCKDIARRKFHFCLAFLSVFIVVLATLVIHSVVDKGPIIFMTLGQEKVGSFDGYYTARSSYEATSANTYSQTRDFLNFTQVDTIFGDRFNLAPRFHICDVKTGYF